MSLIKLFPEKILQIGLFGGYIIGEKNNYVKPYLFGLGGLGEVGEAGRFG
jgi:hypothetical protein